MGPTKYFSTAALEWLVGQGMKLMGVDSGGVELSHDKTHAIAFVVALGSVLGSSG